MSLSLTRTPKAVQFRMDSNTDWTCQEWWGGSQRGDGLDLTRVRVQNGAIGHQSVG